MLRPATCTDVLLLGLVVSGLSGCGDDAGAGDGAIPEAGNDAPASEDGGGLDGRVRDAGSNMDGAPVADASADGARDTGADAAPDDASGDGGSLSLGWFVHVAGPGSAFASSPQRNADGNLVVRVSLSDALDIGTTHLEPDVYMLTFDANGDLLESLPGVSGGGRMLWTADRIYTAGSFTGTSTFLGESHTSTGSWDCFVTAQALDGTPLWVRIFGDTGTDRCPGLAARPGGGIFLAGVFEGNVDFGGGALASAGSTDVFLVALDPDGNELLALRFGGAGVQQGEEVAVGPGGDVYLYGEFGDGFTMGTTPLGPPTGTSDVFLARLDGTGNVSWVRESTGNGSHTAESLAVAPDGGAVITVNFGGTVGFDGLVSRTSATGRLYNVTAGFAPDGTPRFSTALGYGVDDSTRFFDVAVAPSGDIWVGGPVGPTTRRTVFQKYDGSGNALSGLMFTGNDADLFLEVGLDGTLFAAGTFQQRTLETPFGDFAVAGGYDGFVMGLRP